MKKSSILIFILIALLLSACGSAPDKNESAAQEGALIAPAAQDATKSAGGAEKNKILEQPDLSDADVKVLTETAMLHASGVVGIIFGYELQYDEKAEVTKDATANNSFYPVISESYKSVADLKALTEGIFTKEIAEEYYSYCFNEDTPVFKDINGKLYYNTFRGDISWTPDWNYNTMKIVSKTGDKIVVEMQTSCYGEPSGTRQVVLLHQQNGWVLDTMTVEI